MFKVINLINFILKHPHAKKNKILSFTKVISWQIVSRILPSSLISYDFVNNTQLFMKSGLTGSTGNYYAGLHEYREMKFVLNVLKYDDVFIDVGANIGSYSVLSASICKQVYSFEPIKATFDILNKNIKFNDFESKIQSFNIGLSNKKEKLLFTNDLDTVNHVSKVKDKNTIELDVDTLDNVIDLKNKNVFIKIDVEGYELNVLKGSLNLLSSNQVFGILVETNDSSDMYDIKSNEIFNLLSDFGFKAVDYNFENNTIASYKKNDNTIFVKNINEISNRLLSCRI
ncbi:MAG: FkbM family methyltransferase [Candidatus Pelagibacter sp.]|nr:FkbM family methyltransferase [Candidatus Pelagibacter sp.]